MDGQSTPVIHKEAQKDKNKNEWFCIFCASLWVKQTATSIPHQHSPFLY
jgi:hypothetical protein